jgi:hypothetical protein
MRQRNMENGPLAHVCRPSTSVINSGAVSPPFDHNQHCALCDGLHGQMTDAGLADLLHIANVAQPLSLELSGSLSWWLMFQMSPVTEMRLKWNRVENAPCWILYDVDGSSRISA